MQRHGDDRLLPTVSAFRFHLCHDPHGEYPAPFQRRFLRNTGPRISYKLCPHQDKYSFCPNSPLKNYLENHCKGFVVDPSNTYTINYIVAILIANWSKRRLFSQNQDSVLATSYIKKAFRTTSAVIGIRGLRRRIVYQLDAEAEDYFMSIKPQLYIHPLWCLEQKDIELIALLLKRPKNDKCIDFCRNFCTSDLDE